MALEDVFKTAETIYCVLGICPALSQRPLIVRIGIEDLDYLQDRFNTLGGKLMRKARELDVWQETLKKEWRTQKRKENKNVGKNKTTRGSGTGRKQVAKVNLDHHAEAGSLQGKAPQEK